MVMVTPAAIIPWSDVYRPMKNMIPSERGRSSSFWTTSSGFSYAFQVHMNGKTARVVKPGAAKGEGTMRRRSQADSDDRRVSSSSKR